MANSFDKLIDITKAAEMTNKSMSAVRGLVHRRRIPFVKLGGRVMFDPDQLERWLREGYTEVNPLRVDRPTRGQLMDAQDVFFVKMELVKKRWGRFNQEIDAREGAISPDACFELQSKMDLLADTIFDAFILLESIDPK